MSIFACFLTDKFHIIVYSICLNFISNNSLHVVYMYVKNNFMAHFRELPEDEGSNTCACLMPLPLASQILLC